jgi:tripartite-type tricarboxylate transporter receptor subunit TctC
MTYPLSRRAVLTVGAASAALSLSQTTLAQTSRPVRLILPIAAGSGVDTIARTATHALSSAFQSPVVIENMPGAGGIIGASAIARSTPDGSTLGFVSNNHLINGAIYKKLPFDPVADFTPITVVGTSPLLLVVGAKCPAKNVQELVALLKANPDKYNYASTGIGTVIHLANELFLHEAGVRAHHIPYKDTGPMVADLKAGNVDFSVFGASAARPHLLSGAIRAVGVCSATRSAANPSIPTVAEQGLPNVVIEGWFAFIGPAHLPETEVKSAHAAIVTAFSDKEVIEALAKNGASVKPNSPREAAAFFHSESARYMKLAQAAGITPQ